MARYYFDTDDGTLALVDDVGVDLPHDTAAQMEMLRILRELFEGIKMQSEAQSAPSTPARGKPAHRVGHGGVRDDLGPIRS